MVTFKDGFKCGLWMGLGGILIIPGVAMVLTVVLLPIGIPLILIGARIGKKGLVQYADRIVSRRVNMDKEIELREEIAERADPEEWN
jgi:hypothetical protein